MICSMLLDWMDKMMITMLDIGVLCNPDKTTIVSHNHKMDGPELEHWDQSGSLQEFKRILPASALPPLLSHSTLSSDNVFLPGSGQARRPGHNRSETPPRVSIVSSSMARREVKSFVTKCLKLSS